MKPILKKLLIAIRFLLCSLGVYAHDFEVDGIYYQLLSEENQVAVTYYGDAKWQVPDEYKYTGSVVIPETVTYQGATYSVTLIREYAFYECSGLTEIIIPNSVTSIGGYAFHDCGLTEITIPNSVTSIGESAFAYCTGLTEIIIGNSVTSIGDWAFSYCRGLTEVTIPNSVTSIGGYAFHDCAGLTEIFIPNSVTTIRYEAFSGCAGLTSIVIPNSVTSIGLEAFCFCAGLTSVTIPNSVTSIGEYAFYGCTGLKEVTIPNSVTTIGRCAFYGCTGLTEITIPNSVTSIGDNAFQSCFGLTEITIPNSVTSIGELAFYGCTGLTSVTIPNSLTSIGRGTFSYCSGLSSIVVEEGNTAYDSRENCNAIIETSTNTLVTGCKNTVIPNSVTVIGESAFRGCKGLMEISIGNSVTSIGSQAFWDCTGLTEVTIPNSVTSIGDYAFLGCSGLASIVVEGGNTVYDSRENCNAIIETVSNTLIAGCMNTTIPNSVTSIGEYAFGYCIGLTEITIPGSVTSIGDNAFYYCIGLTSITIPNSVTSIGNSAFSYCTGLTEMRVEAVNPPTIYDNTFGQVDKSIPLYVPAESVEAYRTAEYWSEFTNILSIPVENPGEPSANRLQADDVTVAELDGVLSQARVALPIVLVNEAAISAVQCDIYLPAGLSIATTESGMDIALSDRASESHTLMTRALANGAVRVVIMSASAEALTGNEGTLFTLGLLPNENYNTESQIVIRNITMTDTDIVEYTPEQVVVNCRIRQSILGDANRDNKINVTDIVLLAKYILNDYHGDFDALAGDVNQDGKINVSDIVAMANKILSGEGAAGAPTRQEGEKGTLRMDEVQINGENSATASLMLDNSVSYSAFQMDVILPDGVEIAAIERSERISEHHQLMWKEQADGRVRILVFAIDNSEIAAHEGALFDMQLRAQSGFTAGELQVTDATFVTRGTTTHHIDDLAVGVSRTSDLTGNHVGNRVYATGRTLVIENSEAQEARITTADGLSQSIALQPGRNEYPMTQQGVYIVTLGNENKKVIVK